jgi:hypothetical protein
VFRQSLLRFLELSEKTTAEEQQRLLRLPVKRIEWMPEGQNTAQFYYLPKPKRDKEWFATSVRSGGPDRRSLLLLQKAGIPEAKGLGGFPIGGQ